MVKTIKENPLVNSVLRRLCDPVLIYTVLLVMSIMYHYRSSLTLLYGLLAVVLGLVVFSIFDFISRHHLIGSLIYLSVGFLFLMGIRMSIDMGRIDYPITFMLWFISPQDSLDYNGSYTFAVFLLFMFFMASVVYYFNKVRYRIFMNFLIFIIPFAIYGKEYEKMPIVFILLLAAGYIIMMIKYRQLVESDSLKIIERKTIWSSIAVYSAVFVSAAAIIPKPEVNANREYLDMMIDADAFTDRLVAALNVFRDTTEANIFTSKQDDSILYYCRAEEPLRLKTLTYTDYDYETDSWKVRECDTRYKSTGAPDSFRLFETGTLLSDIAGILNDEPSLAEKYGLEMFSEDEITFPETAEMRIEMTAGTAQFMPVPTALSRVVSANTDAKPVLIRSEHLYADDSRFSGGDIFKFEYSRDTFFNNSRNKELSDMLCIDEYENFLLDCSDVSATGTVKDSIYSYSFKDYLLDYGDNEQIAALSAEITDGMTSDYDKAAAITSYFTRKNYEYDLEFKKGKSANVTDFLFKDKKGVCYEFATAAVMLARASGIPARFAEGYNMYESESGDNQTFVIRSRHAHAFPEFYIRGVGWISFEPTVASNGTAASNSNTVSRSLTKAGIYLLCMTLIILLAIKLSPSLFHRLFLIRVSHKGADEQVILSMLRIRKLCGISCASTSDEAVSELNERLGTDISEAASLFDSVVYGQQSATENDGKKAVGSYIKIYGELKNSRRKGKKQRKS